MFSENTEKSDEQSLNSLMSTSPTVLDDSETSILRSLPMDANMTITTSDKEESATRSVETLPAITLLILPEMMIPSFIDHCLCRPQGLRF